MSATSGAVPSCPSISSLPSARPHCVCRTVQSNQRAVHSLDQPLAQSMPQPSCAQILLFFKTSSNAGLAGASSPFGFSFPPGWQLWPPALDLALILLVLLHPVSCWLSLGISHLSAQAKHSAGSSLWFLKIASTGSLQGVLAQSQVLILRRRRWAGTSSQ